MISVDYLKQVISLMKSEGVKNLKAGDVTITLDAPEPAMKSRSILDEEDYGDPDIMNDPFTFGGPRAGVPSFHKHE